jgi:hypothetical protein
VVLLGSDGTTLQVSPEHWWDGETACRDLHGRLPAGSQVPGGERQPSPERAGTTTAAAPAGRTRPLSWLAANWKRVISILLVALWVVGTIMRIATHAGG